MPGLVSPAQGITALVRRDATLAFSGGLLGVDTAHDMAFSVEQTFAAGITGTGSIGALTAPWGNLTSVPSLVNSFNGRSGTVAPASGDYTAAQVTDAAAVNTDNAFSVAQTFSAGLTVPSGQTLTNDGTISGGVVNPASGTVTGAWTVDGALSANAGGSLAGTFSGSPTLSGDPTFSGAPSFTGTGSTGALTAGTGITNTQNTWGATQLLANAKYLGGMNAAGTGWWELAHVDGSNVVHFGDGAAVTHYDGSSNVFGTGITGTGSVGSLTVPWGNLTSVPTLVNSFNGRTGSVSPASGDYSFSEISSGTISSATLGNQLTIGFTGTAAFNMGSNNTLIPNLNAELWGGARNDINYTTKTTSYQTSSTTNVSIGLGVSLAPTTSRILVQGAVQINNETSGDGFHVLIYRSTSGIPSAGSAPGGSDTAVWEYSVSAVDAALRYYAAGICFIDSSLTIGVTYYYYFAASAITGGTIEVSGGSVNFTTLIVSSR